MFRGNWASVGSSYGITGWRAEQTGNTCCFYFERCEFGYCHIGIDAYCSSNTFSSEKASFGAIGTGSLPDSTTFPACCYRLGTAALVTRADVVQNVSPYLARYVHCAGLPGVPGSSLKVEDCFLTMDPTSDDIIIRYDGQLTLINNQISDPTATKPFKIVTANSLLTSLYGPGSIVSLNNGYGAVGANLYAPFYDTSNNLLTGPGAQTYNGLQRASVYSLGDVAMNGAPSQTVHLLPWFGAAPNGGPTCKWAWSGATIANGAAATVTQTWPINGVVNLGDVVTVVYDQPLPAGVFLVGAVVSVTGAAPSVGVVQANIVNMSGAAVTLPAGHVRFALQAQLATAS